MEWYGVVKKIIILHFRNVQEVKLFEYDWYDVSTRNRNKSRGYRKDTYGTIDIDSSQFRYSDDPYIMAIQAGQVCYGGGKI